MKPYILSLLSASLAASVVELLSPKGEGKKTTSYMRMVAGLFLLVALLFPIREGIALVRGAAGGGLTHTLESLLSEHSSEGYEGVFHDTLAHMTRTEAEAYTVSALETGFAIPPTGCTVSVSCVYEETVHVTEVRIALHGVYATRDPHPIEAYFSELWGCPCYVTVGN